MKKSKLLKHLPSDLHITDFFDLEELQKMQNLFSDATGVASIITLPDGTPLTLPSNYSRLCSSLLRSSKNGHLQCKESATQIGKQDFQEPSIIKCINTGLCDAGTDISIGEKHLGNWIIGQVRTESMDESTMIAYANKLGIDQSEYIEAMKEIPYFSTDQFTKIANMLFMFVKQLSEKTYANWILKNKIKEQEIATSYHIEREEHFKILFNQAPLSYQSLDKQGVIIEVNQQWLDLFGYTREEVIGKKFDTIVIPQDKPLFHKHFSDFKHHGVIQTEFRVVNKQNKILVISVDGKIRYSPDGNFEQTHCIIQDITIHHETKKSLYEANYRYQLAMGAAQDGLFDWNLETNEIYYSPGWKQILGYDDNELENSISTWESLTHPIDVKRSWTILNELLVGKRDRFEIEFKMKHKKGHWVEILSRAKTIINSEGKAIRMVGTHLDITELKNTKSSLQETELRYEVILKTAMNGFWVTDLNGRILEVNERYCLMSGYEEKELLNMSIHDLEHLQSKEELLARIQLVKNTKEQRFESKHRRKDGSVFDVEINAQFSTIEGGRNVAFIHDITNRIKIADDLKTTTQTYRQIYNTMTDAIYIQDEAGKFIDVNRGAEQMYQCSREELIGKSPISVAAKGMNDMEEIARLSQEVFLNNTTARFNFWAIRNNKEIFPKEVIVNKGQYFGREVLITTARDMTEQRKDEQNLKNSEEKFRTIFNKSPLGIELYDGDGMQLNANKASLAMFGIPDVNEIKTFNLFDGTSLSERLKNKLKNATAISYESRFNFDKVRNLKQYQTTKRGIAYFEYHITPLLDFEKNSITGYLAHILDITARKKTEETITMLAHSLQSVNECVSITDLSNSIIYVNRAFEKTYGYTKEELINQNINMVGSSKNDLNYNQEVLDASIAGSWAGELINTKKDGSEFPIFLSTTAIKDDEGKTLGLIGVSTDITTSKYEKNELIKARKKAEESDRLKSAFLANMSHEIRTPMNGILGFTELLKEPFLTQKTQEEYIQIIDQSGRRMLNVINDIISISKVEAGQVEIFPSPTNINEQTNYLYSFFKLETDTKGLKLTLYNGLPDGDVLINTDKEKLYAILTNLLKNAIKFTKNGFVEFGYISKEKHLEFYVKDTGPGISTKHQQVIFQRFRQGSESLSRDYEGAGLGLSISKAYVELLGGKIWIESKENIGTTFFFTLPHTLVTTDSKQIKKEQPAIPSPSFPKLKILVAEDDQNSSFLINTLLKPYSYEILNVSDGLEAIEQVKNNADIDLILMDIKMPKIDGLEATRQIRKVNQKIIIVAQTAYALPGDSENALKAGCNDYISKPIGTLKLKNILTKYFK